jgi:hypothetical protein
MFQKFETVSKITLNAVPKSFPWHRHLLSQKINTHGFNLLKEKTVSSINVVKTS